LVVYYIGDHLVGDCRAAANCCRAWRAIAVVEELIPFQAGEKLVQLCDAADQQYVSFREEGDSWPATMLEALSSTTSRFFHTEPSGQLTMSSRILREHCVLAVSDIHALCSERNGDPLWMFRRPQQHTVHFK